MCIFFRKYVQMGKLSQDACAFEKLSTDFHFMPLLNQWKARLNFTKTCLKVRTKINHDIWLMLAPQDQVITDLLQDFQDFHLDLDDDFLIATQRGEKIMELWEIYKISDSQTIQYRPFGTWQIQRQLQQQSVNESRLHVTEVHKWYRRGDLQVILNIVQYKQ